MGLPAHRTRRRALSALISSHINPYGTFHVDMSTHLDLGPTPATQKPPKPASVNTD